MPDLDQLRQEAAFWRGKCPNCGGKGSFPSLGPAGPYDSFCAPCGGSGDGDFVLQGVRVECSGCQIPNRRIEKHCCRCGSMSSTIGTYQHEEMCEGIRKEQGWPTPCPSCNYQHYCRFCHGQGSVPSTRLEDWMEAAAKLGWPFNMQYHGGGWRAWYEDMEDKQGEDPDPLTAVVGAIVKMKEAGQ